VIIKNYKYDYSSGRICYTIDVDGYESAVEHTKTDQGSVQRNDIDDFLSKVEEYDFQEAEMIETFVDFQNDLLLYGIGFELRNEVTD
jgi:gp25